MQKSKFEKYLGSEDNFQIAIARYLDFKKIPWMHSPNEIKAKPVYMKKRKKLGVKSGFPDVAIFQNNLHYKGLFIELKVNKNTLSINQKKWLKNLNNNGYFAFCSYSLDECMQVVEMYLKNSQFELKDNLSINWNE